MLVICVARSTACLSSQPHKLYVIAVLSSLSVAASAALQGDLLHCQCKMSVGELKELMGMQEGTGITKLIPHLSPEGQDLLQKLLMYNPEDRISAKQALRHAFFREIRSASSQEDTVQRFVVPNSHMSVLKKA